MTRVGNGTKGLDEINDDGTVNGCEVAVPVDMNGDVSLKEWTPVVVEDNRVWLNQRQHVVEGLGFPNVWNMGLDDYYKGGHKNCQP